MAPPDDPLATDQPAQTIEERAASNGQPEGEDPQEQLFALDGDKQLTLAGLGPRNMEIQSEVSIMSASVPCRGLIDPQKSGVLMVTYEPAAYRYVPKREGGRIVRWTLRQYVRPTYVEAAVEPDEVKSEDKPSE